MLRCLPQERFVRVVTIKNPPVAVEEPQADKVGVGRIIEVPPNVGILMIAAGWVRSETRSGSRRQQEASPNYNRRQVSDRRSEAE